MNDQNAKEEFIEHVSGKNVLCAKITHGSEWSDSQKHSVLRIGYTPVEFEAFLQSLDFGYDAGFGGQELFGYVWYQDGTWSDRGEYDGSEWWQYQAVPKIPEECAADTKEQNGHIAQQR
jgi:hypothetical protein